LRIGVDRHAPTNILVTKGGLIAASSCPSAQPQVGLGSLLTQEVIAHNLGIANAAHLIAPYTGAADSERGIAHKYGVARYRNRFEKVLNANSELFNNCMFNSMH
jgi:hypothetical protein